VDVVNAPAQPSSEPEPVVAGVVERLGFVRGQTVQEFGYDSDAEDVFRFAVEDTCGAEIEDDDYTGAADAVILWWRDGDGDLGDALVDMVGVLDDGGFVALLTPRGAGDVDASDIEEAAVTAGLHLSGTLNAVDTWRAHRLVAAKNSGRR
jgi:hypothetical protein